MLFPAFAGLSAALALQLSDLALAAGLDPVPIAAIIERESGWDPAAGAARWTPTSTASGLLQFTEYSLKRTLEYLKKPVPAVRYLTRDWLLKLPAREQLPLVIGYFQMTGIAGRQNNRPVDYYLATWGKGIGQPISYILVRQNDPAQYQPGLTGAQVYDMNKGLDLNHDGLITVGDLALAVDTRIAAASNRGVFDLENERLAQAEKKKPVGEAC